MARSAVRRARTRRARAEAPPAGEPRDRIVDALLALAAERDFSGIGLAEVAAEASLSLSVLRASFDGKLAILAEFSRRIDTAVIDKGPAEGGELRDRLFEILMRRFDAIRPHRPALRRIVSSARRDLLLARGLHRIARRSMMWMLVAAGIHRGGIVGRLVVEGTVAAYAEVLRAFLDDDDPGLARTMAALDRALSRGERWMGWLDRVCAFIPGLGERLRGGGGKDAAAGL